MYSFTETWGYCLVKGSPLHDLMTDSATAPSATFALFAESEEPGS